MYWHSQKRQLCWKGQALCCCRLSTVDKRTWERQLNYLCLWLTRTVLYEDLYRRHVQTSLLRQRWVVATHWPGWKAQETSTDTAPWPQQTHRRRVRRASRPSSNTTSAEDERSQPQNLSWDEFVPVTLVMRKYSCIHTQMHVGSVKHYARVNGIAWGHWLAYLFTLELFTGSYVLCQFILHQVLVFISQFTVKKCGQLVKNILG